MRGQPPARLRASGGYGTAIDPTLHRGEPQVRSSRDSEFTDYVMARLPWLRRVAYLLCQDWQSADDLVQAAITRLYTNWGRARSAASVDAYARTVLIRTFLAERRSAWARRVTLSAGYQDRPAAATDHDSRLDVRAALADLPPRQRATLVLRYYCDLPVEETAKELGCTAGTVKSQTAKGLSAMRRALAPVPAEET
jgi:RNA polymerase sigma-70 factor (sigma-E family)